MNCPNRGILVLIASPLHYHLSLNFRDLLFSNLFLKGTRNYIKTQHGTSLNYTWKNYNTTLVTIVTLWHVTVVAHGGHNKGHSLAPPHIPSLAPPPFPCSPNILLAILCWCVIQLIICFVGVWCCHSCLVFSREYLSTCALFGGYLAMMMHRWILCYQSRSPLANTMLCGL